MLNPDSLLHRSDCSAASQQRYHWASLLLRGGLGSALGGALVLWGSFAGSVRAASVADVAITPHEIAALDPVNLNGAALDPVAVMDSSQSLYESGQYQEALKRLKQQLGQAEDANQLQQQAAILGNMALVYQALGEPEKATTAIAQAQTLVTQAGAPALLSTQLLSIQGQLQLNRGQAQTALETWQQVETQYRLLSRLEKDDATRATYQQHLSQAQINQAQALQQLGFYGRALKQLKSLAQRIEAQPDTMAKVAQLRVLGDALQLTGETLETTGDPLKPTEEENDTKKVNAQTVLEKALQLSKVLNPNSPPGFNQEIAALHLSLGNVAQATGNWQEALAQYEKGFDVAPTTLLRLQALVNQLSVNVAREKWEAAEALIPSIQTQLTDVPVGLDAVYAQLQFAQGVTQLASHRQTSTAPRSNSRFTAQTYQQLVANTLAQVHHQTKILGDVRSQSYALGYLGELYQQNKQYEEALGLIRQALALAERGESPEIRYRWHWRMGQLLRELNQREGAIASYDAAIDDLKILRGDLAAVNRDIQFSFRESVEPVYRESVALLLEGDRSTDQVNADANIKANPKANPKASSAANQAMLDKARQRIEDLQLAELDNFFREACLDSQTVLLDKVVDQDNPTAAVIYPIVLENKLEVIVKIPQQPLRQYTIDQSRETIAAVAQELQASLLEPDETFEVKQLSKQLYDWLIKPMESDLDAVDTLVFVLDGPLRSVPMAVLYDGEQYLLENYAVALSLGLQLIDPKPLTQTRLEVLAAGLVDPPENYEQFAPLPEVSEEIARIGRTVAQSKQLLNQDFTREQFETSVNEAPFNVVHLATHGQFSSDADKTFVLAADGPINVNQFDDLLRRRATRQQEAIELLVLSACQTAAGDERATLGLAGVAVRAGARSTLASLWNIGDSSTSLLVSEFYQQLANSEISKAEALRRAQLKLLQDDSSFNRPSAWAPYVLVGNWL